MGGHGNATAQPHLMLDGMPNAANSSAAGDNSANGMPNDLLLQQLQQIQQYVQT